MNFLIPSSVLSFLVNSNETRPPRMHIAKNALPGKYLIIYSDAEKMRMLTTNAEIYTVTRGLSDFSFLSRKKSFANAPNSVVEKINSSKDRSLYRKSSILKYLASIVYNFLLPTSILRCFEHQGSFTDV